jgi:hypothetical protein
MPILSQFDGIWKTHTKTNIPLKFVENVSIASQMRSPICDEEDGLQESI